MKRNHRKLLPILSLVLAAGLLVAAVVTLYYGKGVPTNPNIVVRSAASLGASMSDNGDTESLPRFSSLSQLIRRLRAEEQNRTRDNLLWGAVNGDMALEAPAAAADGTAESDQAADKDDAYSSTNTQVEGVEESDIVKTDGKYIYHLVNNRVEIYKADGEDTVSVAAISQEGTEGVSGVNLLELYLAGDRLVVLGSYYQPYDTYTDGQSDTMRDVVVDGGYADCMWIPGRSFIAYTVYDIANPEKPKEARRFTLEGTSLSTRMIGSKLYFVINKNAHYTDDYTTEDILPTYGDSVVSKEIYTVPVGDVYYFNDEIANSYLIVGVMDVAGEEPVSFNSYLNNGCDIYMNADNLYISMPDWTTGQSQTIVLRFAVTPEGVQYAAKGTVTGQPINQYCMDEYKEVFRIATTDWGRGNYITTLDMNMKQLGQTPALAPDETIQSVRYMDEIGYMVTYRQTDPLYAIDLSNPAKPTVLDALKIPGFSQYLRPVGDGLLIGFGRHTEEITWTVPGVDPDQPIAPDQVEPVDPPDSVDTPNEQPADGQTASDMDEREKEAMESEAEPGIIGGDEPATGANAVPGTVVDRGLKVSLFDISNPKNLKEIDVLYLGENTWSEAFNNPRALLCHPEKELFGFYMEGYDMNKGHSVVTIELVQVEEGKLEKLASLPQENGGTPALYSARAVTIGDWLYGVSNMGVAAYNLSEWEDNEMNND